MTTWSCVKYWYAACLALTVLAAQVAVAQESPPPLFTYRDAILAGGFLVAARLVHPLDDHYAARLQDSSTQANRKLQTLATFVRTTAAPGSYVIGTTMYAAGRLARNRKLASLGLHGTEALAVGELTAGLIKGVVGRQRPFVEPRNANSYQLLRGFRKGNPFQSFPSGHAVAAFAAAAAVTGETSRNAPNTRWIVGPILYGGAALAGVSRMYNNQHWASDVLVGAAIGTFAGLKVVRYHDAHPNNRVDQFLLAGSLMPAPDGGHTVRWSILPASLIARPAR
ncbi:MAG TPA: phosphatase PAP2 family protein [Gemmatimonadaceae bacterium]